MADCRLFRRMRRHLRSALVWAAIPLVVFNGRTVVGCGCFGHFESVCHCSCCSQRKDASTHSGKTACSCCLNHGKAGNVSCCTSKETLECCKLAAKNCQHSNSHGVKGHGCTSIVMHVVVPAVVATSDVNDLHASTDVLAQASFSFLTESPDGRFVDFDTGPPPNDIVISLHRLII